MSAGPVNVDHCAIVVDERMNLAPMRVHEVVEGQISVPAAVQEIRDRLNYSRFALIRDQYCTVIVNADSLLRCDERNM